MSRGITVDYLKSVWRKIAIVLHPDKGGNEESFKEAQREYDFLLNHVKYLLRIEFYFIHFSLKFRQIDQILFQIRKLV